MIKPHGGTLKDLLMAPEERAAIFERIAKLPRVNLSDRQLYDLEMILVGAFSPLEGFMKSADYDSVVENLRLSDGTVWPMPIVLDQKENIFELGSEIVLCDKYGNPIAIMQVEDVYSPDKLKEAKLVFGTTDDTHPGVGYLFNEMGKWNLGGRVTGIALSEKYDFRELRFTPKALREELERKGWNKVVAFQTRNPIHRAHFELIRQAVEKHDIKALIHPVVGLTKEGDIDYITRVRAYKRLHELYAKDFAMLSLLPLAMRMGGPREALWHAIIRKNYGATHFIVGRDHAGPGNDKEGKPFYGPYDAHTLVNQYADEIGMTILTSPEMVYVEELQGYIPETEIKPGHTVKKISGTQFRNMMRGGETVPEWFSFPEIIGELQKGVARENNKGLTIFFTGLSGAGKSTIANIVYTRLLELQDRKITFLDGDVVRLHLSKGLGFTKEDRDTNIERIGFVANEITKHGGIAICAAIAPYQTSRDKNRQLIEKNGTHVEVFVDAPVSVCESRDTKGLYAKARQGILKGFTGIDDPYEIPESPEIHIDSTKMTPWEGAEMIIEHLRKIGFI